MKIRNRLALVFTLSTAFILLGVSLSVYYMALSARKNDFYSRIQERVTVTEKLVLEKENLEPAVYQDIREKFLHTLPDEVEVVEPLSNLAQLDTDRFPAPFLEELKANGYARFQIDDTQGIGQVYAQQGQSYAVIVTAVDQYGIAYTGDLLWLLVIGFGVSVLSVFISGRLFASHALKPIAMKIRQAQNIGAGNLNQRLEVYNKHDELGQLAMTFNGMLDRLQEAFELQRNFVRNASHEIRNPLTAIIGEGEVVLERDRSPEEYKAALINIITEADRLNDLVNDFLDLTRAGSGENMEVVRVDELLWAAHAALDKTRPGHHIKLDLSQMPEDPAGLQVEGNAHLLTVALINLLDNACKFSNNQPVEVSLSAQNGHAQVHINDQGIGIPATDRDRVFEPLYRADNARAFNGTGLGLSIVNRIVTLHNGSLELRSAPGQGTTVSIAIPSGSAAAA